MRGAEPLVESLAWEEDPFRLFRHVATGQHPFLLLSGGAHPARARWTIMGCDPVRIWRDGPAAGGDPFMLVDEALGRPAAASCLPFCGGLVGYLGYECLAAVERVPVRQPEPGDPPDLWLAEYAAALVLDRRDRRARLVARGSHAEGVHALQRLRRRLAQPPLPPGAPPRASGPPRSSFPRGGYRRAVEAIRAAIRQGEVYQANLTQRLDLPLTAGDPVALFERLQHRSPAPHAAYLDLGDWQILSASPERFVRRRNGWAESRPIKGTAPRADRPAEDRRRRRELLASPKDRAENIMIVDLVRNDLNRVCDPGTVRAVALARPETYATVHHLVSRIVGRPVAGCTAGALLRALFPPGSMTGAPKVRAMEILHELEVVPRGPYSGGLGYLSACGDLDLSVLIRAVVMRPGEARVQVGGGVVADSSPEAEERESLLKAHALLDALGAPPAGPARW